MFKELVDKLTGQASTKSAEVDATIHELEALIGRLKEQRPAVVDTFHAAYNPTVVLRARGDYEKVRTDLGSCAAKLVKLTNEELEINRDLATNRERLSKCTAAA